MRRLGVVFLVLLAAGCGGGSGFFHEHSQ